MMFRSAITLSALVTLAACASQPDYREAEAAPTVVETVDLNRYAGLWYEQARYPNAFEEGCEGVTAEYRQRDDGKLDVINTCREGSVSGPERVAEGVARVVDGSDNAKLKVKFAPQWVPFASGDYWILHLEPDYSAVLVGDPSGKYLWILSRQPELDAATYSKIVTRAEELGYLSDPLRRTLQPPA